MNTRLAAGLSGVVTIDSISIVCAWQGRKKGYHRIAYGADGFIWAHWPRFRARHHPRGTPVDFFSIV